MCELLALSTSQPARLTFSLRTLAAHGGLSGRSHDGWGVAFYQGRDVALFREPVAAADSPLVRHLETQGPATELAISHIRHATQGGLSLANTQPFMRELGGRIHVFAHNGDLPGIYRSSRFALGAHRPVGQTDSEHAFCALLLRLSVLWDGAGSPTPGMRASVLAGFAAELRELGPANFLYADGEALFAHGHRRMQSASGRAEPPGLWYLPRECEALPVEAAPTDADNLAGVTIERASRHSLLVASVPLSEGPWRPLDEGQLLVVQSGQAVAHPPP
jgi:predicted glutamine amidotransferase